MTRTGGSGPSGGKGESASWTAEDASVNHNLAIFC